MKVLIDHPVPFFLAHGGLQIQIEQTKAALEAVDIDVEWVRWWDAQQSGQIIHYFGRPTVDYIDFAHAKGMKVVIAELLSGLGSRFDLMRTVQKAIMTVAQTVLPRGFTGKLAWDSYKKADAFSAGTEWEAHLMRNMFGADPARTFIVPNGVEAIFFQHLTDGSRRPAGEYLVCTAAIHPRKRILELARTAVCARVPVWIIGKPYSESDAYYCQFLEVQKRNPDLIRYEGGISDRAQLAKIYQGARGFVLLSTMETLSLSSLEAAAAGCPLLLSDLPWARSSFGDAANYADGSLSPENMAPRLREFYDQAPTLQTKFKPQTWPEIGALFKNVYLKALE